MKNSSPPPMNREIWVQRWTEWYAPPLRCPTCGKGDLSLIPKSLSHWETAKSRRAHHDEDWSHQDVDFRFTARLKCGHGPCGDEAVAIGKGWIEEQMTQEGWEPSNYFSPDCIMPMPDMISISQRCPTPVALELRACFQLFWLDRAAAANRIRVGIERIMDHFKVPIRGRRHPKDKLDKLSLNTRLKRFEKTDKIIADRLTAMKWLGNTGSHQSDKVTREDILDALELLEDALVELFERRTHRMKALTRGLLQRHRPRKPKRSMRSRNP